MPFEHFPSNSSLDRDRRVKPGPGVEEKMRRLHASDLVMVRCGNNHRGHGWGLGPVALLPTSAWLESWSLASALHGHTWPEIMMDIVRMF